MGAYIARRLLLMIPTIFGIMLLSFAVIQFAPGGPVEQVIAQITGQGGDGTERISGGGSDFGNEQDRQTQSSGTASTSKYRGAQGLDPEFIKELEEQSGVVPHSVLEETFPRMFICVDGVYGMTGDLAPLPDLVELKNKYNAKLFEFLSDRCSNIDNSECIPSGGASNSGYFENRESFPEDDYVPSNPLSAHSLYQQHKCTTTTKSNGKL